MPVPPARLLQSARAGGNRRLASWVAAGSLICGAMGWGSVLGDDRPAPDAARPAWDDPTLSVADRAQRALDAANALDDQARRASSVEVSRAKWLEASRLLDDFVEHNEANAAVTSLRFQAAVYLWARARASLDQVDLWPTADPARVDVADGLDEAIGRLRRAATTGKTSDAIQQNIRFRLAQALADRARLLPENDPARTAMEKEAQQLLDRSLDAPRLRGFAQLLHAELANRLGEFGPAQVEVEEAEKLKPPPPLIPLTEAKVTALAGRGQFAEAAGVADRAAASAEQKALWKLRISLARQKFTAIGRDRQANQVEIFDAAKALGDGSRPETARGLMELARRVDQPAAGSPIEWWEILITGQLLLHEPERAARLAGRAADLAASAGGDRAAMLRFKEGACWFQAARYAEADAALTRVVEDLPAPRPLRARAGMLRALGRGRALTENQPGASKAAYLAALEGQLRDFGDEPASAEARWLLGKLRLAAGRREEAGALWAGIRHGQARWLEAQVGAANLAIAAIEAQWINHDVAAVQPRVEAARRLIRAAVDQAAEGQEVVQLGFTLGSLESIPGAGRPADAVAIYDRLLRGPASPEQHQQARLARMVALAEQNRFVEAEATARTEARRSEVAALLPAVRLLDQWASLTENDLIRKRTGNLLRILLDPWADPPDRSPPEDRDEVRLRHARACLFAGDLPQARRLIARWGGPTGPVDDPQFLRDLGDTYFRLEAFSLGIDAERLRATKLAAGTPAWFDSRYLLALGLYRSGQGKEARKVIEATTILHPDLGGGEIRSKFDRLSQKISTD